MIRKAVIAAAGFGTRFLPVAKAQPKEMLPVVDTPTIQMVVEEAVSAGITDILIIIGKGKRAIEEHFDRNFELEAELVAKEKTTELLAIRRLSEIADIHFVWQKAPRGLADAVWCARHHVNGEPFLLLLGDTVIQSRSSVARRLIELYEQYNEPVVALETVDPARVDRYGIVGGTPIADRVYRIQTLIEKPAASEAPSNLAVASRYAFSPRIFEYIGKTAPGKNQELQLTDSMRLMLCDSALYGYVIEGRRHDLGNKLDFLKTNVLYGLQHPEVGAEFREFVQALGVSLSSGSSASLGS